MTDQEKNTLRVLMAASRWWHTKKPIAMKREDHHKHPAVNCVTASEKRLARAVSKLLRGK